MTQRSISLLFALICWTCAVGCAPGTGFSPSREWTAWSRSEGGILRGVDAEVHRARAESLLADLEIFAETRPMSVQILSNPRIRAWAWDDGTLFVTHGMLEHLDDDELSAAIAHELAHFFAAGSPTDDANVIERRADAGGSRILAAAGRPTAAMASMLRKLAADVSPAHARTIRDRIAHLDALRVAAN